jgi:hypothetical protein
MISSFGVSIIFRAGGKGVPLVEPLPDDHHPKVGVTGLIGIFLFINPKLLEELRRSVIRLNVPTGSTTVVIVGCCVVCSN